jgi:hypothetical protein
MARSRRRLKHKEDKVLFAYFGGEVIAFSAILGKKSDLQIGAGLSGLFSL